MLSSSEGPKGPRSQPACYRATVLYCLLNRLFKPTSHMTDNIKARVTGSLWGDYSQRGNNTENVSIEWRRNVFFCSRCGCSMSFCLGLIYLAISSRVPTLVLGQPYDCLSLDTCITMTSSNGNIFRVRVRSHVRFVRNPHGLLHFWLVTFQQEWSHGVHCGAVRPANQAKKLPQPRCQKLPQRPLRLKRDSPNTR